MAWYNETGRGLIQSTGDDSMSLKEFFLILIFVGIPFSLAFACLWVLTH